MKDKKLKIENLLNAYTKFTQGLDFAELEESGNLVGIIPGEDMGRSVAIHYFEYTFELSWKIMKKFLKLVSINPENPSLRSLFQKSQEIELIDDANKWMEFSSARNTASHNYDEEVAKMVYDVAKEFDAYAKKFISTIEKKIKEYGFEE
jgi:nucleotidyltransferase substrate binding protein (TIGR01987 family)